MTFFLPMAVSQIGQFVFGDVWKSLYELQSNGLGLRIGRVLILIGRDWVICRILAIMIGRGLIIGRGLVIDRAMTILIDRGLVIGRTMTILIGRGLVIDSDWQNFDFHRQKYS